jgi:hypothetical protein
MKHFSRQNNGIVSCGKKPRLTQSKQGWSAETIRFPTTPASVEFRPVNICALETFGPRRF